MIAEGHGKRYDPKVVEAFMDLFGRVGEFIPQQEPAAALLGVADLKPGMALAGDLISRDGILLLSKEYILDERLIEQICNFERTEGNSMQIHIRTGRR